MKIRDLREEVRRTDGEMKIGPVTVSYEDDCDIDFKLNGELLAWISKGHEDGDEVSESMSMCKDAIRNIDALFTIAEYIGIAVGVNRNRPSHGPTEHSNEDRLSGMVAAYEKILIGREISAKA